MPSIILLKLLILALKLLGKGDGTVLPGLMAEKYFPRLFGRLLNTIPKKIVVTGTNGKTTTQTILKLILSEKYEKVINNGAGANLKRGLVSELVKRANLFGQVRCDVAIFEVEEATFPKIAKELNADLVIVTNIFRDQLDAYGEIDITGNYILEGIKKSPKAKVVLNGDDLRVANMAKEIENDVAFVKLPKDLVGLFPYENTGQKQVKFSKQELAKREVQNFEVFDYSVNEDLKINCSIKTTGEILKFNKLNLPGFFHLYNLAYAYIGGRIMGVTIGDTKKALQKFEPAFGRGEVIKEKGKEFKLLLIKNPAGFNLTLELLRNIPNAEILMIINDNIADSTDVSWLWDSRLEKLKDSKVKKLYCSGTRAQDMQVRLKYADIGGLVDFCENSIAKAITKIHQTSKAKTIYVLPTYTAMLELRKYFGKNLE